MKPSFHVYVVELDMGPRAPKGVRGAAPKAGPRLAGSGSGRSPVLSVYVGSTAHSTASRMLRHLQGRKASRYVREHGVRLRPDLARGVGPFETRGRARDGERQLAERLRRRGYRVYGACASCKL